MLASAHSTCARPPRDKPPLAAAAPDADVWMTGVCAHWSSDFLNIVLLDIFTFAAI